MVRWAGMIVLLAGGAAYGREAAPNLVTAEQAALVVELVDVDAARAVELRCPAGHRDAATFLFGRAVLRAPEGGCTLYFLDQDGSSAARAAGSYGPTGAGELLCERSAEGAISCLEVCDPLAPLPE